MGRRLFFVFVLFCFLCVPGHVGIRGNPAADSAAKDALVGEISVELIPFSDLKPRANRFRTVAV